MKRKTREEIKEIQKRRIAQQVLKFNSVILGIQNYYRMAIIANINFSKVEYAVNKSLRNKLGKLSKKMDNEYKLGYKGYNYQVWNLAGITFFSIRTCKFKIPRLFSTKNKVVKEEKIESNILEDLKVRAKLRFFRNSTCDITGKYIGEKDDLYNSKRTWRHGRYK